MRSCDACSQAMMPSGRGGSFGPSETKRDDALRRGPGTTGDSESGYLSEVYVGLKNIGTTVARGLTGHRFGHGGEPATTVISSSSIRACCASSSNACYSISDL